MQNATFKRCIKWILRRWRTPRLNQLSPFHIELKRQRLADAEAAAALVETVAADGVTSEPSVSSRRNRTQLPKPWTEEQLQQLQTFLNDPERANQVRGSIRETCH